MSRQILAIDIRNALIAAVVLTTSLKANTVAACSYVPFNGDTADKDALNVALNELLANIPTEDVGLVLAVPSNRSIFRTVTIPFKESNKIKQVLPFELEPNLPLPVEDLVIDFQKEILAEQSEVLATALEHRYLDLYQGLFHEYHLEPQLVVPGSFPTVLSLISHDAQLPEQALVVDVDRENVTLYAIAAKRISLIRSLPASIETEVETEHLALKIRQTLTAFADAHALDFSPTVAYLHGPCLDDPDAVTRLSNALSMPVQTMALHQRINKVEINGNLPYNSWIYDNALASACLEADGKACPNFHRSSSTIRNFWVTYRPFIKVPAILLVIITCLGLGSVLYDSHQLQKKSDGITRQMEQIFKSTFPGASLSKAPVLAQMQSKLKEAQKTTAAPIQAGNRMRAMDALLEISRLLPDSITIVVNRMVVSEDTVTLSGETGGFKTVDDIKGRIEKSTFFKKVTIASANMDKSGTNIRFKLKIDL